MAANSKIITAQRDSARQYANPATMVGHLWRQRELIRQFTKRRVLERYKGSYLGLVWSFVTPLAMLAVYTFVFSVIFKARWEGAVTGSHAEFALALFAGLIAFNIFSESTLAAPGLVNHFRRMILWGQLPDWAEFRITTILTG